MLFSSISLATKRQLASALSLRRNSTKSWSHFTLNDKHLTIPELNSSLSYLWLRDACRSPECVHPSTSQKLFRTSDIPLDIKPATDGVQLTEEGLRIQWTDGHTSLYTTSFLEWHVKLSQARPNEAAALHRDVLPSSWDHSRIASSPDLFLEYESIKTPSGLLTAINNLCQYGLLFIRGVPNSETSNETCELSALAERFGEIRETFYGKLWDVKNVSNSRNIAYTNLDLGLHMDLLYFQHPPQYQILHCLRNQVTGGTSIFVDALLAAEKLRDSPDPTDFDVLSTTQVPFHYINDGHHLHFAHPTIEVDSSSPDRRIKQINYSPPFQAPLHLNTDPKLFTALRRFGEVLNDPQNTLRHTLQEGEAVLFDNRRVLHARTAFSEIEGRTKEGETNRWLKGCYLEGDAMWDRGRVLRANANL